MNFKRGHYLISTMLHKTIMAILYCSYQCNAISALKQSILKQNITIAKERKERERKRETSQPTNLWRKYAYSKASWKRKFT